ncbi:MAG: hypothetical protein IIA66_13170 [Planctomycetes bacterium]|nr:hypothetical protein [Planctomycetota bacterium]
MQNISYQAFIATAVMVPAIPFFITWFVALFWKDPSEAHFILVTSVILWTFWVTTMCTLRAATFFLTVNPIMGVLFSVPVIMSLLLYPLALSYRTSLTSPPTKLDLRRQTRITVSWIFLVACSIFEAVAVYWIS